MNAEQLEKIAWLNRARLADENTRVMEIVYQKNIEIQRRLSVEETSKDEESEIRQSLEQVTVYRNEISRVISEVNNNQYRKILTLRYLGYMKMDDISELLHKELRTIQRNHKKAIDAVKIPV